MTSRDWAGLCWLVIICGWLLGRSDLRSNFKDIAKTAWTPKIVFPIVLLLAWVVGLVALGARTGLWTTNLTRDTVLWTIVSASALLFSVTESTRTDHFFRKAVLRTFAFAVLVEFYLNLVTFSFWVEFLLLLPFVTIVTLLAAVAGTDEKTAKIKPFFDWLLVIIGAVILVHVTWRLIEGANVDVPTELRRLAMPIWLTTGILPIVFIVALLSHYELLFMRLGFAVSDPQALRRARRAAVLGLRLHNTAVGQFDGAWLQTLANAETPSAARQVVKDYRRSRRSS